MADDLTGPDNLATLAVFDGNGGMTPETNQYEFMGALKPGYKYELKLRFGFYEKANNDYQDAGRFPQLQCRCDSA